MNIGIDGKSKLMEKGFVGIDGKAKEIDKIYAGVDNKAKLIYTSIPPTKKIMTFGIQGISSNTKYCFTYNIDVDSTPSGTLTPNTTVQFTYPSLSIGGGGGNYYSFNDGIVAGYLQSGSQWGYKVYNYDNPTVIKEGSYTLNRDSSFYSYLNRYAYNQDNECYYNHLTASGMAWNFGHTLAFGYKNGEIVFPMGQINSYTDSESSGWAQSNYTAKNFYGGYYDTDGGQYGLFQNLNSTGTWTFRFGSKSNNGSPDYLNPFTDAFACDYGDNNKVYLYRTDITAKTCTVTNSSIVVPSNIKTTVIPYFNKENHAQQFLCPTAISGNYLNCNIYNAETGGAVGSIANLPISSTDFVLNSWQDPIDNTMYLIHGDFGTFGSEIPTSGAKLTKIWSDGRSNPLIWSVVLANVLNAKLYNPGSLRPILREIPIEK